MKSHEISAEKIAEKRGWFANHGIALSHWADQHQVKRNVLYQVLEGKSRCTRGESHKIAVLLGLRPQASTAIVDSHEQVMSPGHRTLSAGVIGSHISQTATLA